PFKESQHSGKQTTVFKNQSLNNWDSLYVGLESKGNDFKQEFSEVHFESEDATESFFDNDTHAEPFQTTYQLHNKYIVSTIKSGMLVLDQYRAHQRILYEDFLKSMTIKEGMSQQLLFPLELHFSTTDMEIIKQLKQDLEHAGFVFSNLQKDSVDITGLPVNIPEQDVRNILEYLISDVENE